MAMRFWSVLLCLGTIGCSRGATALVSCDEANDPKLVVERCHGGDLHRGKYVGDQACYPFSAPERFFGTWRVARDRSEVQTDPTPEAGPMRAWLAVEKLPPVVAASMQRDRPRAFAVELVGWRSICQAHYGQQGRWPYEIVVDHFLDVRELGEDRG
jgi:hypothetical protein